MNKFAFQNNARQSHLPASLAAASSLLPLTRYPPRRTPIPRASLHSSPPPLPAPPRIPLFVASSAAFLRLVIPLPPSMRRGTRSLSPPAPPPAQPHNPTFFIPSYQLIRF